MKMHQAGDFDSYSLFSRGLGGLNLYFSNTLLALSIRLDNRHKYERADMNEQRKIMVIGGLHGDETLGIDLVNRIRNKPIAGIDAIFGNPMATSVKARYIVGVAYRR
jgi:hypothetical protein